MTEQPYTLAAILVRLTEREQQIEAHAVALRAEIEQLTSRLGELERQLEHVQITRKTLVDLPEPDLPSAPPVTQDPPEHPAYEQILAALTAADQPMRAREVTMASHALRGRAGGFRACHDAGRAGAGGDGGAVVGAVVSAAGPGARDVGGVRAAVQAA